MVAICEIEKKFLITLINIVKNKNLNFLFNFSDLKFLKFKNGRFFFLNNQIWLEKHDRIVRSFIVSFIITRYKGKTLGKHEWRLLRIFYFYFSGRGWVCEEILLLCLTNTCRSASHHRRRGRIFTNIVSCIQDVLLSALAAF